MYKDIIILWWLWKRNVGCNERVGWCSLVWEGGENGGNVIKGFFKEVIFKLSFEYIGVGLENYILGKGNYLYKGF